MLFLENFLLQKNDFTAKGFEPSILGGQSVGQNHKKLKFSIDSVRNCTFSVLYIKLHQISVN